ncbi:hypothetical protein PIB30_100421 [Stylosanthes scabra]|uniref:Uncharacterized protein n=1 Tax=Stylosanthes scabra TaxID=79078 RepID=A0ABU6TXM0_9FABA|nr:hypothetical protein [Stylosanthes scabra]
MQLSTTLPNAFPSNTVVNPMVEYYAITIRNGEALQDSKQEGLNKEDIKGTPTNPPKEEIVINAIQCPEEEDEEWCMRMDELDAIVQKNIAEMQQEHLELQLPRVDEVQPNNVKMQQQNHDSLQQKNNGKVQWKTKYATLKGRPTMMLNSLPTILKYAFLGNAKNLTYQYKILVDISHMLNTMKHEIRKLWDPEK